MTPVHAHYLPSVITMGYGPVASIFACAICYLTLLNTSQNCWYACQTGLTSTLLHMRFASSMTSGDITDYKTLFLEAGEWWKREEERWKQAEEEQRCQAGLKRRAAEQTERTTFDNEKVPSKTAPVDRISNPAGGQISLQWEAVEHRARHSKPPMLNIGLYCCWKRYDLLMVAGALARSRDISCPAASSGFCGPCFPRSNWPGQDLLPPWGLGNSAYATCDGLGSLSAASRIYLLVQNSMS